MANILEDIEKVDNYLKDTIAEYLFGLVGMDIYLKDVPFIKPDNPYLTFKILEMDNPGWSSFDSIQDSKITYKLDNTMRVELNAISGNPMSALVYITQALKGFQEYNYQKLYSKGIGILSVTNATDTSQPLDNIGTERKARMFIDLSCVIKADDIELPNPIEKVGITINAKEGNKTITFKSQID